MNIEVGNEKSSRNGSGKRGETCACSNYKLLSIWTNPTCRKEWLQYANWEVRQH